MKQILLCISSLIFLYLFRFPMGKNMKSSGFFLHYKTSARCHSMPYRYVKCKLIDYTTILVNSRLSWFRRFYWVSYSYIIWNTWKKLLLYASDSFEDNNCTYFCLPSIIQKETELSSTLMILLQRMLWPKCPEKSPTKMDTRFSVIKYICCQLAGLVHEWCNRMTHDRLFTKSFNIFCVIQWCSTAFYLGSDRWQLCWISASLRAYPNRTWS